MSTTSRLQTPDAIAGTGPVVPVVGHFVRGPASVVAPANGNPVSLTDFVPSQHGTGVAML
jgi:hypothetical protein